MTTLTEWNCGWCFSLFSCLLFGYVLVFEWTKKKIPPLHRMNKWMAFSLSFTVYMCLKWHSISISNELYSLLSTLYFHVFNRNIFLAVKFTSNTMNTLSWPFVNHFLTPSCFNVSCGHSLLNPKGTYACEVSTESPSYSTVRAEQAMKIYVLPKERVYVDGFTGSQTSVEIGDLINVTCVSGASKPAPKMAWFINGEMVSVSPPI